jgi:hypothetical protein
MNKITMLFFDFSKGGLFSTPQKEARYKLNFSVQGIKNSLQIFKEISLPIINQINSLESKDFNLTVELVNFYHPLVNLLCSTLLTSDLLELFICFCSFCIFRTL